MIEITNISTKDNFLIAENDHETILTMEDVRALCEELGDGWRIPNESELLSIYNSLYLKNLGNFKNKVYWGSNKLKAFSRTIVCDFETGIVRTSHRNDVKYYFRPVRDI